MLRANNQTMTSAAISSRHSAALAPAILAFAGFCGSLISIASAQTQPPSVAATPAAPSPAARSPATPAAAPRQTSKWNLASGTKLAIDGYDPVAYFPEGGGTPAKGSAEIKVDYRGATYRFVNADHKQKFEQNPAKYEPAHGGWCSWAIREGDTVEIDPKSYIVRDGRLFLFYNGWLGDTRAKWIKGQHATYLTEADTSWNKLSGEKPPVATPATPVATPAAPAAGTSGPGTLSTKLGAIAEKFASSASTEVQSKVAGGIKGVEASGATRTALAVGADAPSFELTDIRGQRQSLKAMLANGPVVMTFYRGGWCPYCTTQLSAYEAAMPEMKALGALMVAISPQTMEASKSAAEAVKLSYTVLSDQGNTVAKSYGVSHAIPADIAPMYRPLLAKSNGDADSELPLAATYVIDRQGKIAYAYVNADYRQRAEPSEIIAALRTLSQAK